MGSLGVRLDLSQAREDRRTVVENRGISMTELTPKGAPVASPGRMSEAGLTAAIYAGKRRNP